MNYYPHHIGDFNNATRHLTRIERSIYRDMMELYYDTEQALPLDVKALCRKLMARSEEEVTAVEQVLNEFFTETEQGWINGRCDKEIEAYHKKLKDKSEAGKASAAARAAKSTPTKAAPDKASDQSATDVQQPLASCSTNQNQEPITNNQIKEQSAPQDASRLLAFDQFWKAYPKKSAKGDAEKAFKKIAPSVELLQTILDAIEAQKHGKAWLDEDGKYIPNPATWLNAKRWDDEVQPYAGPAVKQSSAPWWSSDALILAKGAEMGMKPHNGEYMPSFKGRVQAAIDNGGKPPAPPRSNVTTFADDGKGYSKPADVPPLKSLIKTRDAA